MFGWMYSAAVYITSEIVGMHRLKPPFQDLSDPEKYGLPNAVNLRIPFPTEEEGELGAWFIRPTSGDSELRAIDRWIALTRQREAAARAQAVEEEKNAEDDQAHLSDPHETVVLYFHGNANSRGQGHRVDLYKFLMSLGLPVMAVDYRGYADSSELPRNTESAFLEDATLSFQWLKAHAHPKSRVIIWGHSLGTGVAVALGAALSGKGMSCPDGYVLEAPFVSMINMGEYYKISKMYSFFGGDADAFLKDCDLTFGSGEQIKKIEQPVAILHARDDSVVPYASGEKLYQVAVENNCNVTLYSYDASLGLGHNKICTSDQVKEDFIEFLSSVGKREK